MFSIHLAEPERRPSRRPKLPDMLFGKLLGFTAGLTLIFSADALILHGQLLQSFGESFALNWPALVRTIEAAWALITGR